MANPHRGEVSFRADGRDWTLRYGVNTLCEMEEAYGKGIPEIAAMLSENPDARTVRRIFWYGVKDRHTDVEEAQAGELMTDVGLGASIGLISEAFSRAFPEAAEGAEDGGPRPPKGGKAGNGKRS